MCVYSISPHKLPFVNELHYVLHNIAGSWSLKRPALFQCKSYLIRRGKRLKNEKAVASCIMAYKAS